MKSTKEDGSNIFGGKIKTYDNIYESTLNEVVKVLFHPEVRDLFGDVFISAFGNMNSKLKNSIINYIMECYSDIISVRNSLSHSRVVSYEKMVIVIGYVTLINVALKEKIFKLGVPEMDYFPSFNNVIIDGVTFPIDNHHRNSGGTLVYVIRDKNFKEGEEIRVDVGVDPAFDQKDYEIIWEIAGVPKNSKHATVKVNRGISGNFKFEINLKNTFGLGLYRYVRKDDSIRILIMNIGLSDDSIAMLKDFRKI